MNPFLRYTLLRIALLAGCLAVAAITGWWSLEGVVVAIFVSAILSFFLLRAPREELARDIEDRVEGRMAHKRSSWDLDNEAEDAEVDARR